MRITGLKKAVLVSIVVLTVLCLVTLLSLRFSIQSSLDKLCSTAQAAHLHDGDTIASLIDYVNSGSHTLRQRNHAVWTLGQLRDPAALPALEKACTGKPCDHETTLCQYEIEKAIKLCRGQTPNILCIRQPK